MKYIVSPKNSRRGQLRITAESAERAESVRKTQEVLTGIAWEVTTEK